MPSVSTDAWHRFRPRGLHGDPPTQVLHLRGQAGKHLEGGHDAAPLAAGAFEVHRKTRRRTGRVAVRSFGEAPSSERSRQTLPGRRRKGPAGTRQCGGVGQRGSGKPARFAEHRGIRHAERRHFLHTAIHAGKPTSARHARRPATFDHGPRGSRIRHGVLPRRARIRRHCRHSLRTQPHTAGSSRLAPPGHRPSRRPCPVQRRPFHLHEYHGRHVRAKLPAMRRKRFFPLGPRGDKQRRRPATTHRRRTGNRVRRRPKLSAK